MTTEPEMMTDARGRFVPISHIKPVDLLRDRTVRELVAEAVRVSAMLGDLKNKLNEDLDAFLTLSDEQYGASKGGVKGNLQLVSYDGLLKVTRQISDHIQFDERLQAAKKLIDECVIEWSRTADDKVRILVQHAFQTDRLGRISTERVLGLRKLAITDEKWQAAMAAISDSVQVVGSTAYLRFYRRDSPTAEWDPIPLDLTNARPTTQGDTDERRD
jgi:hypothetical protein